MTDKQTVYLKDYQPYPFELLSTVLVFHLAPTQTRVSAKMAFKKKQVGSLENLVLNGDGLKLVSIKLNGNELAEKDYQIQVQDLIISEVPDEFVLETEVEIDPKNNTQLMGLYQSNGAFCTQCEAHGFRRITYYPDRPDVLTEFTVTIVSDEIYPQLLSNGNLVEQKKLADGRHQVTWHDPFKKPCYLFALVAGDFDVLEDEFITCSGRNIDLRIYVEKGYKDQARFAMESLKRAMKWDEDVYGREYDLDIFMIVAVFDFNFGAMENKGLNIFNAKYILANNETATDHDFTLVEEVVAHEYFHNWSGNRVTCRDWFQITLKEGFTVFRDQTFTEDMTSKAVKRIEDVNVIRSAQFLEDASPMAHPIQPQSYIEMNNFYTVTVYNKGAEVIRMLHTFLGEKTFRQATDAYFSKFDGQAVTTEDFLQAMESVSKLDLSQFRRWYYQAGTPQLTVTDQYDANNKIYTLTVKQHCDKTADRSPKDPFMLPLSIGLLDSSGNDMALQLKGEDEVVTGTKVLTISELEHHFEFFNVLEKPTPSLLRHFSAPVKLHYQYDDDTLAWLMVNDNDPFNRWDAGQQLACREILAEIENLRQGRTFVGSKRLVSAFEAILHTEQDPHLASFSLTLPSENYLQQQMEVVEPLLVHRARRSMKQFLAKSLQSLLLTQYQSLLDKKPYAYTVVDSGKRALKNTLLNYLLVLDEPNFVQAAYDQYLQVDNMTDKLGALEALNNSMALEREAALMNFYEQYSEETLVVDKWLRLQASSYLPDTLIKVKKLLHHPAYNAKNPNKIRALIGAFSQNHAMLHAEDGSGYRFLTEQVLLTDKVNSMTAARLVTPLTLWRRYDEKRQQQLRQCLQEILAVESLSKDVYEVVSKALQGE